MNYISLRGYLAKCYIDCTSPGSIASIRLMLRVLEEYERGVRHRSFNGYEDKWCLQDDLS